MSNPGSAVICVYATHTLCVSTTTTVLLPVILIVSLINHKYNYNSVKYTMSCVK